LRLEVLNICPISANYPLSLGRLLSALLISQTYEQVKIRSLREVGLLPRRGNFFIPASGSSLFNTFPEQQIRHVEATRPLWHLISATTVGSVVVSGVRAHLSTTMRPFASLFSDKVVWFGPVSALLSTAYAPPPFMDLCLVGRASPEDLTLANLHRF